MSNYTKTTDFAAKDALLTGNPSKLVKGTEINTEFSNIQTAVNSKLDSSGVTAFAATLLDDIDAATARGTLGAAASGANTDITSLGVLTNINGVGFSKNVVINGGFTINQRAYVSAAVLASGSYGHDRWKAGAGGGDYSFTQLASNTQITIAANKTLIQVVEDKNVQSTRYVVSWTGTALGRVGVNSATPSGAYAASPIIISGQTAGTTMSVEFGNGASSGTLGTVQVEATTGSVASAWTPYFGIFGGEQQACQRYLPAFVFPANVSYVGAMNADAANAGVAILPFQVPSRVAPTGMSGAVAASLTAKIGSSSYVCSAVTMNTITVNTMVGALDINFSGGTLGGGILRSTAAQTILFTGCEL